MTELKQRVKLSNISSSCLDILKDVPQGSVLGLAFFYIFMTDIYGFIKEAELAHYADDNTLSYVVENINKISSS